MKFRVIDLQTGKEADIKNIMENERWLFTLWLACKQDGTPVENCQFMINEESNTVFGISNNNGVLKLPTDLKERFKIEFIEE